METGNFQELQQAIKVRDEEKCAKMLEPVRDAIRRYAICKLGDYQEAADVSSDVIMALVVNVSERKNILPQDRLVAWLFRVARNQCVNRHRKSRAKHFPDNTYSKEAAPDRATEHQEEVQLIKTAMAILSKEDRQILEMRTYEELFHEEIKECLGLVSVEASRQRYSRALRRRPSISSNTAIRARAA